MADKVWQVEQVKYCEHVGQNVEIESQVIYPADILPEQPPRVVAHRCSHSIECNLVEKPSCSLCGTNPDFNLV